MSTQSSKLTQEQLLRQRLMPQQLRFAAMLEQTQEELEDEINLELQENPALVKASEPLDERRYYNPRPVADTDDWQPQVRNNEPTLAEHLQSQLDELTEVDPAIRAIASYMTGALDPNGYMTRTLPQLRDDLATLGPAPTMEQIRTAADLLRSLDPAGVGAQDLRDTLLLQLRRLPEGKPYREEAIEVVRHWWDLFAARSMRRLADEAEMSPEVISHVGELISTLNPKPGSGFASDFTQSAGNAAVSPDFLVETDGERLTVSALNSLPQLQLEESFLPESEPAGDAGEFVRSRRKQAQSFIELLQRRQSTLMRIVRAIANYQAKFFLSGDDEAALRPMVLRQLARQTGLDLSTISRAISGKWLATAWGVYPLKFFFSHRGAESDSDISTHAIQAAMRELIDSEDPTHPLSDEEIAARLTAQGLKTARRTVAKYRAALSIPPARLRKS